MDRRRYKSGDNIPPRFRRNYTRNETLVGQETLNYYNQSQNSYAPTSEERGWQNNRKAIWNNRSRSPGSSSDNWRIRNDDKQLKKWGGQERGIETRDEIVRFGESHHEKDPIYEPNGPTMTAAPDSGYMFSRFPDSHNGNSPTQTNPYYEHGQQEMERNGYPAPKSPIQQNVQSSPKSRHSSPSLTGTSHSYPHFRQQSPSKFNYNRTPSQPLQQFQPPTTINSHTNYQTPQPNPTINNAPTHTSEIEDEAIEQLRNCEIHEGTRDGSKLCTFGNILLYIDNSNIFIHTQRHAARVLKFKHGIDQDRRARVDVGKLLEVASRGRHVLKGRLYGSEPPALDTVWRAIRHKRIEVTHSQRSTCSSREKKTDTNLTAEAVEDLLTYKNHATETSSVVLFTGDGDMIPLVRMALKNGWKVEVWSYECALAKEFRDEARQTNNVVVHLIDQVFSDIVYWNYQFSSARKLPKDRTIVLQFDEPISAKNRGKMESRIEAVMKASTALFKLPTAGCFIRPRDQDLNFKVLTVVSITHQNDTSQKKVYDFNDQIWSKIEELRNQTKGCVQIVTLIDFVQKGCKFEIYDEDECYEAVTSDEDDGGSNGYDTDQEYDQEVASDFGDLEDPSVKLPDDVANSATSSASNGSEVQETNGHESSDSSTGFTIVSRKERQRKQIYSNYCKFRYRCPHGRNCHYNHSNLEKEYFNKERNGIYRKYYKSKPCTRFENRCCYNVDKPHLCPYAHGLAEAFCVRCKETGKHWSDECPYYEKQTETKQLK